MHRRGARRRAVVLLVAALLLLGSPYPRAVCAEDAEAPPVLPGPDAERPLPTTEQLEAFVDKVLQKDRVPKQAGLWVAEALRGGGKAVKGFDLSAATALAVVPPAALVFNRGTFEGFSTIRLRDVESLASHVDRCLLVAILLDRRKTPTDETRLASAYGRLVHAWARFMTADKVDVPRVVAAATALCALGTARPVNWYPFVLAAIVHAAVDPAIGAWADGEVARLRVERPDDPQVARLDTFRALSTAIRLEEHGDKSAAAALTKVLPPLAPDAAIPEADWDLTRLYNHAITAARRLKLTVKAQYRTTKVRSASGLVHFELPRHTGWESMRGDGDQDDGSWVRETETRGKTTIQVWKYSTNTDYVDSEGKVVGGDNIGGRLKMELENDKLALAKVRRVSPSVGKVSRGIPSSRGYEIRGEDIAGIGQWIQEWFFKSDVRRAALNISVRRSGRSLADDPELEFILETMQEPEPPKGK